MSHTKAYLTYENPKKVPLNGFNSMITVDTISPLTEIEIAGICVIAVSVIIVISMFLLDRLSKRKKKKNGR